MKLSQRVLRFRQERSLTQAQFARAAGVSNGTISNIEFGLKCPRTRGKVLQFLLDNDTPPQPKPKPERHRPMLIATARGFAKWYGLGLAA